MLTSITPLGERSRGQRWRITIAAFVLGSPAAGAALGLMLGAIGAAVDATVGIIWDTRCDTTKSMNISAWFTALLSGIQIPKAVVPVSSAAMGPSGAVAIPVAWSAASAGEATLSLLDASRRGRGTRKPLLGHRRLALPAGPTTDVEVPLPAAARRRLDRGRRIRAIAVVDARDAEGRQASLRHAVTLRGARRGAMRP